MKEPTGEILLAVLTYLGATHMLVRGFSYPTNEADWIAFTVSLTLVVGIGIGKGTKR